MSTITYKKQPAIALTGGHIYEGYQEPYTVTDLLWPEQVHRWIANRLTGASLHICCGKSQIGTCRVDLYESNVDVKADAARLPFSNLSWDTVLIDPPYNGVFQWNHDMLSELARVARLRIIFQHWFIPVNRNRQFKKAHRFHLTEVAIWQPSTYFGRAHIISIMDATQQLLFGS